MSNQAASTKQVTLDSTVQATGVYVDLSDTSTLEILFQKPDQSYSKVTATATGDNNEKATAEFTPTELDQVGSYYLQIYAVMNGGEEYYSEVIPQTFLKNIPRD